MSGSENGTERAVVSPGRVLGARSASPAKRTAADMEGGDKSRSTVPGSFGKEPESGITDFDEAMAGLEAGTSTGTDAMDTQESLAESMDTSVPGTMSTNTSATSFQSDGLPPYTAEASGDSVLRADTNYTKEEIDLQQAKVMQKQTQKPVDEGQKGVLVSNKWLGRVMSRSSEGLKSSEFPKDAREGPIGPVDNSDIVADGGFLEPFLYDQQGRKFIPVKPGLVSGVDYEIMNDDAWGVVTAAYGIAQGQYQIERYARNTAPADAVQENIQFEVYPPIITVRKVAQPHQEAEQQKPVTSSSSLIALRLRDEARKRGQTSPDDAVRLVSSRNERFQKFLARSKEAAGIPRTTKVRMFKMLDPSEVGLDGAVPIAPSTSTLSKGADSTPAKLVVSVDEFKQMETGKDLEPIDAKDETNNSNYNGSSTMEMHVLANQSQTLLLEEVIGGPGGGEYLSDKLRVNPKFRITKKDGGSKPGSAPASGRTSPAPQSGMMTRGRARRDGRTRGVVGLTNLGNTCYMNSALQCIRSVEELAVFFLSEQYKREINADNPLGHKGAMAKQYASILNNIYADNAISTVTPTAFKKLIGSIQPMFSGYGQQDSQEFLSFLVDALHEDLNRIIKKPYNENPDSDDNTVHDPQAIIELGEIYQKNHRARNDSVAMDLFSGFYKNTMECPVCDKISITFDPYSLLTVQLPIEHTFQHPVTFVPLRSRPVNHMIDIDKNSTIKMLKEYIASKHPGVQADRLWMIECYNHKIYKVFDNAQTLAEANIQTNDYLFVFELEDVPSNPPQPEKKSYYSSYSFGTNRDDKVPGMDDPKADRFAVPVFSRQKSRIGNGFDITLHPVYITLTREEAMDYEIILKKVLIAVTRLTSTPILSQEADTSSNEISPTDEMDKDDQVREPNAQVTDTSSSEDGYVNVSVNKLEQSGDSASNMNGVDTSDDRPIPPRFMEPDYFISPTLRNQLFALNYAQGDNNMYCASMSSISDRTVRDMFGRVKLPSRRNSIQSSSSGEESTTSTGSGAQANGQTDDSESELDKPDITLGGESEMSESYLSLPTPVDDEDSGDAAFDAAMSRKGRRKRNKHGKKGRRGNQKTYSKKDRKGQQSGGFTSVNQNQRLGNKTSFGEDDNPYYIKLGEGIVLDWYPEPFNNLFGGSTTDPDETRGHFVSHSDGKGIPYLEDPEVTAKRELREARKRNGITLDDCFVETGKREVLSEDNAWYCNRCKELRRATKTLEIWTIPDILVVHLKRFGGTRSFRDKIDVLVDYPIEGLDMTERIGLKEDGKEYVYDLFAVDNHYGGLGGGHYTALAKNFNDGQWYDYNDSHTSKIGENKLHSAAAYLLFYRRRSDKPLGPQYLQDLVTEFRNPPSADETAEESDSGEGRLGGPNGSGSLLNGSSSALTVAGAGAAGTLGASRGFSTSALGAGAGLTPMTKESLDEAGGLEIDSGPVYGPQRPPYMGYGNQGNSGWSFASLDTQVADDAAGALMSNMDDDGDADSMGPNMDIDEEAGGWQDAQEFTASSMSAGRGTPVDSSPGWPVDDHAVYSSAHEDFGDSLHLEDAGMTGQEEDDGPVEIYPGPPTLGRLDEDMEVFSGDPS